MAAGLRLPPRTAGLIRFALGIAVAGFVAFGFKSETVGGPLPPLVVQNPTVIDASATQAPDGTWRFDVTVSSPYDSPEQYADAWRISNPDGTVYGVRELLHDHANEQPFTRSLSDVAIPDEVETVVIQARDSEDGWALSTFEYELP